MNALEWKGLWKRRGDFTLGPLDLTLPEGCCLGLVGENGAGKTTAIRLTLDMLRRDGGTVTLYGRDSRETAREELGVVPDEAGFPGVLNAAEIGKVLAGVYRSWDAALWRELLDRFALPEKKRFKEYSLGMRKKLSIAAALAHHPRLLLLDEPTGGLDPVARDEVVTMFSDFTREADHAVLISSHIVSDLEKLCDYVAFLHRGRLLLWGEKDRLREDYGLLRCPPGETAKIDPAAVLGRRETPYGTELLLRREDAPGEMEPGRLELEELFVLMAKEAE